MPKYILKRAIMSLITAFLVATMTFFVMNMVPGGPFLAEKAVTPQAQGFSMVTSVFPLRRGEEP